MSRLAKYNPKRFFIAKLTGKIVLSYIIVFISHYVGLSFIEPFLENVDDTSTVYIGIIIFAAMMTAVIILLLKLDWARIMSKFAPWTLDENNNDENNKDENNDELEDFYLFRRLDEKNSLQDIAKKDVLENFFGKDVKSALEKLPYQFRLMVLLCDVEGFSYNETATIIDASLKTVVSRLYHGRKLFQRNLWRFVKERQ